MRKERIFQQQLEEKKQTLTSLHLFAILRHVVWSDGPQELNVVITVVFCHLFTTGFVWSLETNRKMMRKKVTADTSPFVSSRWVCPILTRLYSLTCDKVIQIFKRQLAN